MYWRANLHTALHSFESVKSKGFRKCNTSMYIKAKTKKKTKKKQQQQKKTNKKQQQKTKRQKTKNIPIRV